MPQEQTQPASAVASIVVVGDIHANWRQEDRLFLDRGDQDLALIVGDLGDEDVEMARKIASLKCEKAVILGNHDAWRSFSEKMPTDNLRESLSLLGDDHLAYGSRDLPQASLSLIGARPFSWGGRDLRSPEVYEEFYGVSDMRQSAERIVSAAMRAKFDDLIILAHNGPTGLGSEPGDIYGKDFGRSPRGDFGDEDLAIALAEIERQGRRVIAVVAGHMHDRLKHPRGQLRQRFVRQNGTAFINPAVVPRIRRTESGATVRHFLRMSVSSEGLQDVDEIWVDAWGKIRKVDVPEFAELPVEQA
ncbi:MAG: TIGR04168 family protein [Planctomycetota bacterium]|jgi:uncharacterized protein (TIGR04168 family)